MLRQMEDMLYTGVGAALKGSAVLLKSARSAVERRSAVAERGRNFVRDAAEQADKLRIRLVAAGRTRLDRAIDGAGLAKKSRLSELEARLGRLEREREQSS